MTYDDLMTTRSGEPSSPKLPVAATIRLRRCTERTPRSIAGARFARVLDLERAIMRATGCGFGAMFAAAEVDADAIARRYHIYLP